MTVNPQTQTQRSYSPGPTRHQDDVSITARFFTYRSSAGFVAGDNILVEFTIDSPVSDVWPVASDWNIWMNEPGSYYYSGVMRDLEGQTYSLSLKPNDTEMPHFYKVDKVIDEHLIVMSQPVLTDEDLEVYPLPGMGGASGGYHVFMLAEHDGQTRISVYMEHESVMARGADADTITPDEALEPWREALPAALDRWRDDFIPALRNAVAEAA